MEKEDCKTSESQLWQMLTRYVTCVGLAGRACVPLSQIHNSVVLFRICIV
jgi:hypothetical protein